jgi:hypothetical protein
MQESGKTWQISEKPIVDIDDSSDFAPAAVEALLNTSL